MGRSWVGKRLGAAAVVLDEQGRGLLVKHSYGRLNWELPGGAVEAGETVAQTAMRETLEETGLTVEAERLTGMYNIAENDSHHFVFMCRMTGQGQQANSVSDETTDCGYFSPESLPRPISDFTVRRIQDALAESASLLPLAVGPLMWLG